MILPNIENFIGCDSSFEEAGIVQMCIRDRAYATAVILLIFVLVLNGVSGLCAKHLSKATNGQ